MMFCSVHGGADYGLIFSVARYRSIASFLKGLPIPCWRLEAFSGVLSFDSEETCGMVLSVIIVSIIFT